MRRSAASAAALGYDGKWVLHPSQIEAANQAFAPSAADYSRAGLVLGVAFAAWQRQAAHPLLPPRVVLDRNRGGAYLSIFIGTAGLFGTFLFLTYWAGPPPARASSCQEMHMNVTAFGATGRVDSQVVGQLRSRGHTVTA